MEALKNSFERLKQTIVSSNPNPWWGIMMSALNEFETEFNTHLDSLTQVVSEPEATVVKTTKKKATENTTPVE